MQLDGTVADNILSLGSPGPIYSLDSMTRTNLRVMQLKIGFPPKWI